MIVLRRIMWCASLLFPLVVAADLPAQTFGVELHNTAMPASGGMAGASVARPQDLLSAINANPATLTQYRGTQFCFGGFWAEPTYNLSHSGGVLPNVGSFSAKSGTPGTAGMNVGVSQDFSALGLPATFGIALISDGGGGTDFRNVPGSNGTSTELVILEVTTALGVQLTDRMAAGASLSLGTAFFDGLFVGQSAMVPDYALRAALGFTYDVAPCTTVGAYYQTKQGYTFDNAIRLEISPGVFDPVYLDVNMDLPDNVVFGIANDALLDGRLLLALDVIYNRWDDATLYRALYTDQWVFQLGAQYSRGPWRLRLGYAYAENPLRESVGINAGGVTVGTDAIQYAQAQMAAINEHRVTAGVGMVDVLPGIDFDMFVGAMFEASQDFGASSVSVESYWLGAGLTWRFGRGSCERLPVPNCWNCCGY